MTLALTEKISNVELVRAIFIYYNMFKLQVSAIYIISIQKVNLAKRNRTLTDALDYFIASYNNFA